MLFSNLWEQIKEFLNLDAQKRALLVTYILLGGIIYFQNSQIQNYIQKEENTSKLIRDIQEKNEMHCQELLLKARTKYQENRERERDIYQIKVDSLIDIVTSVRRKYKSDNLKLIKKLNQDEN